MRNLSFLIIGCGSIGSRHLRNLQKIGVNHIFAADPDDNKRAFVKKEYNINETYASHIDALKQNTIDAVLICAPTSLHIPLSYDALNYDCHVFIEKPLSHNMEGVQKLYSLAKKKKKHIAIGFNLRFHPNMKKIQEILNSEMIGKVLFARIEVGQYLPDWHPHKNYRKGYSALEHLGGGIILDATHELDYAQILFGDIKKLFCYADKISGLEINTEDIAEMILIFNSGVICNIHVDYLQRTYSRFCKIIGEKGTIMWQFKNNIIDVYMAELNKLVEYRENNYDYNETYIDEMKHFINCIKGSEKRLYDVKVDLAHMKCVAALKKSVLEEKVIYL